MPCANCGRENEPIHILCSVCRDLGELSKVRAERDRYKADWEKLGNPTVGQLLPNGLVAITQAACGDLVKCDRYRKALEDIAGNRDNPHATIVGLTWIAKEVLKVSL